MPRPSWRGVLRLSLVPCPVYLMPATSRTKTIRLNQVWVPPEAPHRPRIPSDRMGAVAPDDEEDFEDARAQARSHPASEEASMPPRVPR
jgi:non-homologous end joining protein Ku